MSACKRILYVEQTHKDKIPKDHVIISIENGLEVGETDDQTYDVCYVTLTTPSGYQVYKKSYPIDLPVKYYNEAALRTPQDYELKHLGFAVTAGEIIHEKYPDIPSNNWMADPMFGSNDRKEQITYALNECLNEYKAHLLKEKLLYFDDFKASTLHG